MDNPIQPSSNMNLPQPVVDTVAVNQGTAVPTQSVSIPQPQHQPVAQSQPQARAGAQDRDVIEPEWVNAVEQTMRHSIEDPRRLAQEFGLLKAQYVQKRFGKEIKGPSTDGQV